MEEEELLVQTAQNVNFTLQLNTSTGDDLPIYVVGNFNNWTVQDERFRMKPVGNHTYVLPFPEEVALPSLVEYKYIKGSWGREELDEFGSSVENRTILNPNGHYYDYILRWRNHGKSYNRHFLPKIHIIHQRFYISQLNKYRRVTALLPYNYHETDKHYPVLYLQDGQNLFDDHAPYGNWAINRRLAVMAEKGMGDLIVVAIDHGERERITEYMPLENLELGIGRGEGSKYVEFISETLKPHIDKQLRTLSAREHTGVGGSSMGGLISLYAGLMRPDIFGKLMIFSPSLWIYPDVYTEIVEKYAAQGLRVYLFAGGRESQTMIPNVMQLKYAFEEHPDRDNLIELVLDYRATHSEAWWGRKFPYACKWLFCR